MEFWVTSLRRFLPISNEICARERGVEIWSKVSITPIQNPSRTLQSDRINRITCRCHHVEYACLKRDFAASMMCWLAGQLWGQGLKTKRWRRWPEFCGSKKSVRSSERSISGKPMPFVLGQMQTFWCRLQALEKAGLEGSRVAPEAGPVQWRSYAVSSVGSCDPRGCQGVG